jgi:hypothetical protein
MRTQIFFALCLGLALAAQADTYGPFEYWANKDSGYVVIVDLDDQATEAEIPTTIEGLPVTTIAAHAFQGSTNLVSIIIPETVTWIGREAFWGCSNLQNLILPDSLQTLSGDSVFRGCSSLTSIALPDNLKDLSFGSHFNDCTSLETVSIGSNTGINGPSFAVWFNYDNCPNLGTVEVDESHPSYTSINGAVYDKTLTTLHFVPRTMQGAFVIPDTVTRIEGSAFEDCTKLTSITIPDSVTEINTNFTTCTSLIAINVGENNPNFSSIDGVLFNKDGTVLHKVPSGMSGEYQVPEGVSTVGGLTGSFEYGFAGCSKLTAIGIPSSVTSFVNEVGRRNPWFGAPFWGCTSLTSIEVHGDNPNYASVDGVLFSKDLATLVKLPAGFTGSYVIPDNVTGLGGEFPGWALESGLSSITVGSGLASGWSIEDFSICEALTWIDVSEANSNYASVDGVLFSKDQTTLVAFPRGRTGSYSIPDGTISIGGGFLQSNLTSVTIPDSVWSVGDLTFGYCRNLTDVTIGNGVTGIGGWAFYNCTSLTNVVLPDIVTYIGENAFWGCTDLASISLGEGVTTIGYGAFSDCRKLTSISIPDSVTSLGDHVFDGCRSLENLNIGNGLATTGYNTFASCIYLTEVTIPASVANMDGGAFNFCSNLRQVYFLGEPPVSGIDQFIDTHSNLVTYYIQGTPGWGDTYAGVPTAPFLPSWGSFVPTPNPNGIYVDTGDWLGWLDITIRPWVWSYTANEWLYMPEPVAAAQGGWLFIPNLVLEAPGLWILMVEGTNYGWSYSLEKWLYITPEAIQAGSGWVYML